MKDTAESLQQLKSILFTTDLQYQMIADKLGLEILQCGIDYFNGSNAYDAARKAMRIQSYAMGVVVGKMAKDRCKENVDILQKIIDNLPPQEIFEEDNAIKEELRKFNQSPDKITYAVTLQSLQSPDKISHAVTLLSNTKPHLQSIMAKLGVDNSFYLKLSTLVIDNALYNVIEEVNAVQKDETLEDIFLDSELKFRKKIAVLQAAWKAMLIMDTFDMQQDFKTNRYLQNRAILKDICDQMGILLMISQSSESSTTTRVTTPRSVPSSMPRSTSTQQTSSSSSDDTNWGCIVTIAIAVIIGLISMCS